MKKIILLIPFIFLLFACSPKENNIELHTYHIASESNGYWTTSEIRVRIDLEYLHDDFYNRVSDAEGVIRFDDGTEFDIDFDLDEFSNRSPSYSVSLDYEKYKDVSIEEIEITIYDDTNEEQREHYHYWHRDLVEE